MNKKEESIGLSRRKLVRSTYALSDVASLSGLDVDDLVEMHVAKGDLDLYVKVPSGLSAYSVIKNYLDIRPNGKTVCLPFPELVQPISHPQIEAVLLSRQDCEMLARFRRVEQNLFAAGLALNSSDETEISGQGEYTRSFELICVRDWSFIPGQEESLLPRFGNAAILSEESLYLLNKGVTFRPMSDVEISGAASDLRPVHSLSSHLHRRYEHWFGLYQKPPAGVPSADRYRGISIPHTLSISQSDVWVTRNDLAEFLVKLGLQYSDKASYAGSKSHGGVSEKNECIDNHLEVNYPPQGIPESCNGYSCMHLMSLDSGGTARAIPSDEMPDLLNLLFTVREATWAVEWGSKVGLSKDFLDGFNKSEVIDRLIEEACKNGVFLSANKAAALAYFICPIWARSSAKTHEKREWGGTYETPEFMQMISAARKVVEWRKTNAREPVNSIIDGFLTEVDPLPISEARLKYARALVRQKSAGPGRPKKIVHSDRE